MGEFVIFVSVFTPDKISQEPMFLGEILTMDGYYSYVEVEKRCAAKKPSRILRTA